MLVIYACGTNGQIARWKGDFALGYNGSGISKEIFYMFRIKANVLEVGMVYGKSIV